MKKIILITAFIFLLFGCDSGPSLEYDEETVKKDALEYLEKKYGGNYEFNSSGSSGGTNWVNVSFTDLDRSNENGSTLIIVEWYEDGTMTDYKNTVGQGIIYDKLTI